jgi:RNA 3'-terminal phosphate cyclase (ATP)
LPVALAGGRYETSQPSLHTLSNIEVVDAFLDAEVSCRELSPDRWRISMKPTR